MTDTLLSLGIQIGIPAAVGIVCLIFARFFPKEKALSIAKVFRKWGKLVSKLGNTKLGKKSMDRLEEGPIATLLGFIGTCISEFAAGLAEDNVTEQVKKKIDPSLLKAFDEAIKK